MVPMRVTRVLHVSVNTALATEGLDAARRFYGGTLGLASVPRPEIPGIDGLWFSVGDAQLHLVDTATSVDDGGADPTANHFCIAVEDLLAAIDELEAAGIPYVRGAQGDVVQIWLADPIGNTIELQQDQAVALRANPG
ncbi:MAG: VOC family protein [Acidimicrobiales bacterium]